MSDWRGTEFVRSGIEEREREISGKIERARGIENGNSGVMEFRDGEEGERGRRKREARGIWRAAEWS